VPVGENDTVMVVAIGSTEPGPDRHADPQIAHDDTPDKADHHHAVVRHSGHRTTSPRSVALTGPGVTTERVHQQESVMLLGTRAMPIRGRKTAGLWSDAKANEPTRVRGAAPLTENLEFDAVTAVAKRSSASARTR
jgi:hypothetical protein